MPATATWSYPTEIRFGAGRIMELAAGCRGLGMTHPLLVTDAGLATAAMVLDAIEACRADGLEVALFSEVKGNPTGGNVDAGVAALRDGGHDGVIAFGGGSALDAGKAIALMARQTASLWDFVDLGDNWKRADVGAMVPVVAVPTTAGTGSEVGRASVITNEAEHAKKIVFHPRMMPGLVIADPVLSVGLPRHLTAATGIDALTHSLEAFCSPRYHPMSRGIAVEGMRLVNDNLVRAVEDGGDIEARGDMLVASSMGAVAFQRGLGGVHAMSHALGALLDAHHGLLNAILLPYVLVRNRPAIAEDCVDLAASLGLPGTGFDGVMDWVLSLRERVGIPASLGAAGLDGFDMDQASTLAEVDPSGSTNPIALSKADYAKLLAQGVKGDLG